jgi:glycosyltransferase involved in cell wall biosynthesis
LYLVGSDVLRVSKARGLLARYAGKKASLLIANGEGLARKARVLMTRNDVIPLYIGIDTKRFTPVARPRSGPIQLMCTRWFEAVYDNATIIRALTQLPPDLPDWHMTFASSGSLLEQAKALAGRLLRPEVRRRVTFSGGLTGEDLRQLVVSADIYVSMSLSDGTSTALLEALAAGVFPVVSDIEASREWVDGAGRGLLVPACNDQALSEALALAIRDPALRASAVVLNRQSVLQRADAAANRKRLSELLRATQAEKRSWVAQRVG